MSKGTIAGIGCDDEGYVYEIHSMGDKTMVKEENICVESQSQGMREKFEELCFPPAQEPTPEA